MQIGPYTLSDRDRARGVYVIGGSGSGKSEFLKSMALRDIEAGHGLCFIDPHGDTRPRDTRPHPREPRRRRDLPQPGRQGVLTGPQSLRRAGTH
jgi:DNA helicase HerA-like ATPase